MAIPTIPLMMLELKVIFVWVLKSILLVSLVCCTMARAPIIIVNDETLVSHTSSSLPKKSAIRGDAKNTKAYNSRLRPRLTINAVL